MRETLESLDQQWTACQTGSELPGYSAALTKLRAEKRPVVFESPWRKQNPNYRSQHLLGAGDVLLGLVNRGDESVTVRASAGDLVRTLELPLGQRVEFAFPFIAAYWDHVSISPLPNRLHGIWALLPDPERRTMALSDWRWGSEYHVTSGSLKRLPAATGGGLDPPFTPGHVSSGAVARTGSS